MERRIGVVARIADTVTVEIGLVGIGGRRTIVVGGAATVAVGVTAAARDARARVAAIGDTADVAVDAGRAVAGGRGGRARRRGGVRTGATRRGRGGRAPRRSRGRAPRRTWSRWRRARCRRRQ